MRKFLATVAVAALAISTAHAQGNGNGKGNGGGGKENAGEMMSAGKGNGGNGKADKGGNDNVPRAVTREGSNPGNGKARMEMPVRAEAPGRSDDNRNDRADMRGNGNGNGAANRYVGGNDDGRDRGDWAGVVTRRGDKVDRVAWRGIDDRFDGNGLIQGCPPGLAKKNNGCMPPGQAKKVDDWRMDRDWWGVRTLRDLTGYRYYDGSLVRYGANGGITGYYPLLGGALAIGNPWPNYYQPVSLDPYYVDYYNLGNDYRYFDRAIYRVDPETQAIAAIAGLLTGDDFAIGSPLPVGYGVYNVPYGYRDRYVDGPDAYYRYSDGYVYQVDPKTQLIVAAIQLLT